MEPIPATEPQPHDPIVIPSLLEYVLAKVREASDHRQLATVCKEAGVDESWAYKFAAGKIPGASYEKVHALAEYFFRRDCAAELEAGRPAPIWPFLPVPPPAMDARAQ